MSRLFSRYADRRLFRFYEIGAALPGKSLSSALLNRELTGLDLKRVVGGNETRRHIDAADIWRGNGATPSAVPAEKVWRGSTGGAGVRPSRFEYVDFPALYEIGAAWAHKLIYKDKPNFRWITHSRPHLIVSPHDGPYSISGVAHVNDRGR